MALKVKILTILMSHFDEPICVVGKGINGYSDTLVQ